MKHFSGFGAYLLFLALRAHFNKADYDFYKFNGKLRYSNRVSYTKRTDQSFFERLAKMYDGEELRDFYVANFLADRHYVIEMAEEHGHETYYNHVSWLQSFTYNFTNEAGRLFALSANPFQLSEDEYPPIILMYLQNLVSLQTLVILDDFTGFSRRFDIYLDGDMLWGKIAFKMQKFRPFLCYDKAKVKTILKEIANDRNTLG